MTAFDHAWTLLKQRGFEVDPRYEDQRLEDLQTTKDDIDTLRDHRAKVLAEINRLSQLGTPESDAKIQQLVEGGHTSPLAYEMFPAQSIPTGGYVGGGLRDVSDEMSFLTHPDADMHGPPYYNTAMLEPYTGAMFQEKQRQEAMEREAMGMPNLVYVEELGEYIPEEMLGVDAQPFYIPGYTDERGTTPVSVSSEDYGVTDLHPTEGPPADIGRAGSISNIIDPRNDDLVYDSRTDRYIPDPVIPSPDFSFNPFDPNEVALRRQTMANEQTPLGQALARVRAGSGPRPLQFDQ